MNNINDNKFKDPITTVDGNERAFIEAKRIKTLWFNTQEHFVILNVKIVISSLVLKMIDSVSYTHLRAHET